MKSETEKKIIQALDVRERNKGGLPPILTLYRQLMLLQSEARAKIELPSLKLDRNAVSNRLKAGQPLLEFEDIPIDWALFQSLFKQASSLILAYLKTDTCISDDLKETQNLKPTAESWYKKNALGSRRENTETLGLMLQTAFKPFLNTTGEVLLESMDQEQWLQPYCPICGDSPDFSFLDKERGARYLVCSRCDAEWLFKRMECPFCGNQEQTTLAYFTDSTGLYRLYVCEKCKNYLKAVDLRCTEDPVLMPLERLITLDLDAQAIEKGYAVCAKGKSDKKQKIVSK